LTANSWGISHCFPQNESYVAPYTESAILSAGKCVEVGFPVLRRKGVAKNKSGMRVHSRML